VNILVRFLIAEKARTVVWQDREKSKLRPYLQPTMELFHPKGEFRKVDKTSLISYKSVKYSVPTIYQSSSVIVKEEDNDLIIFNPESGEEIARHKVRREKGVIVKNRNHYRDHQKDIDDYERSITSLLGETSHLNVPAQRKHRGIRLLLKMDCQ